MEPKCLMKPYEKVYQIVAMVPFGKVTTYGKVARLAGVQNPRIVGYALSNLGLDTKVPWHRVVNYRGAISMRKGEGPSLQKSMLRSEGIEFNRKDCINLETYLC